MNQAAALQSLTTKMHYIKTCMTHANKLFN
uniref:Uncharacterized protein n=1 Tax=Rhizophora mucronata TaxID=61149 RepID=A0A2P2NXN9_RHIMU